MRSIVKDISLASKFRTLPAGVITLLLLATAACGSTSESTGDEASEANSISKNVSDSGFPIIVDAGTPTLGGDYHQFLGAWSASPKNEFISEIVFENGVVGSGHAFFADLGAAASDKPTLGTASGHGSRVSGSYEITRDFVILHAPSLEGTYRYSFIEPGVIQTVIAGIELTFKRSESYCDTASDCGGQDIKHVECVGEFTCNAHACNWQCGGPVQGDACGKTTCNYGTYCCNPLEGICTPAGIACTQ